MSSVTSIQSSTAAAVATPVVSTKPAELSSSVAKPASPAKAGPAATLQLSQQALAKLKGDKDWRPGERVDSF